VTHADQLLSKAFARADGMRQASPALADIRRRWEDLRADRVDPPQILIGNYAVLAQDLDRIAPSARTNVPRRPRSEAGH
jgi:hypothetical protein